MNNIKIGSSMDYMQNCLGSPLFEYYHENENVYELLYENKYGVVRAYYENKKLIAFFVTAKKSNHDIELPNQFEEFCNNEAIGDFTYTDIKNGPFALESFISNGTGHSYYVEKYDFVSRGNYYTFYFGYLDYGFKKMSYSEDKFLEDEEINTIRPEKTGGIITIDRDNSYPNTYGIIECEKEFVYEMISNYRTFNLQSLRFE